MKDIPIDDLKILVDEIIHQRTIKEKEKRRNFWVDLAKVTLTPLIIAIVGSWGTHKINQQNLKNTELIAKQQIEAAHIRAERVEKSADLRSQANRDVERLTQIKEIFEEIVEEEQKGNPDSSIIKLLISSLEIYGDLAIDFLVKIRDIYQNNHQYIADHADKAIFNILQASQPDFRDKHFVGKDDVPLNLRTRKLNGFNFSGSLFENVNLYQAQFIRSSLKKVQFRNADLFGADFSEANLNGAVFDTNTNLRNTDFSRAYLRNVEFKNCRNLSDAKFSINALLNANQDPFKGIEKEDYLKLLVRSITDEKDIENLKNRHKEDIKKFRALLKKVDMEFGQLLEYLQEKYDQQMASAQNHGNRVDAGA
jgi:uncharacterized protein YjbI with pentapeptide repeats